MRKEHLQQAEEAAAAAGHMDDMEKKIGSYFCELVSEWNPCYSDGGDARFQWDEEVGAHDVIATVTRSTLHSYPKHPRRNTPPHKPHHHEHTKNRFQLFQRSQQTWGCHVLPRTSWQFGSRATTAPTFPQPVTVFTKQITSSLNVYHLFSHRPVLTNS